MFLQQEMEVNRTIMRTRYGSDEQAVLLRRLQLCSRGAIGCHHGLVTASATTVATFLYLKNTWSRTTLKMMPHLKLAAISVG